MHFDSYFFLVSKNNFLYSGQYLNEKVKTSGTEKKKIDVRAVTSYNYL